MTDVAVLLGSKNDREIALKAVEIFEKLGISYTVNIASAHRTPARVVEIIQKSHEDGVKVFIAIAGLAAHLPGVIASHTVKPVIGVPVNTAMDGIDALLSIAQMPGGIPVACVGIGRGDNAAILAAQIMATGNMELMEKLTAHRKELADQIIQDSQILFEKLAIN